MQHIKKRLPELRTEVATLERQKRSELLALGTSLADGSEDFLRETMLRLLTQYSRDFSDGLQVRPGVLWMHRSSRLPPMHVQSSVAIPQALLSNSVQLLLGAVSG